jgi:glycine betaine/proline transport system permease protein
MQLIDMVEFPIAEGIDAALNWLTGHLSEVTESISVGMEAGIDFLVSALVFVPPVIFIAVVTILVLIFSDTGLGIFTGIGLVIIWGMQLWEPMMSTIALIFISTVIAVAGGIPLGIIAGLSDRFHAFITPILDFMQTMPAFVYLIPAIPFFGLGPVAAVFATVIFSVPPSIRLTSLGIRQVDPELIEASNAFGSTTGQRLFQIQLPLATPTIMAGVNQNIMLALSMVVIAAMIGAGGLGGEVWRAIQRLQPGSGFEAGIAVVIVAMLFDRISKRIVR